MFYDFDNRKTLFTYCRIRGSLLGFYDRLSSPNARGDARDVARSCWRLLGERGGKHGGVFFDHGQGTIGSGPMLHMDAHLFIVYEL